MAFAGALLIASGAASAEKLKVGFIYIGPPGDFGWTYAHDQGRMQIEKELGDRVETTFVENVPEGPDAERAIAKLAETGHELIFTTSFGYMDPTIKVAKEFPNVKFEHATGYKTADNMAVYSSKFYQGRYIQGIIADDREGTLATAHSASINFGRKIEGQQFTMTSNLEALLNQELRLQTLSTAVASQEKTISFTNVTARTDGGNTSDTTQYDANAGVGGTPTVLVNTSNAT